MATRTVVRRLRAVGVTLDPRTIERLDELAERLGLASRSATIRYVVAQVTRDAGTSSENSLKIGPQSS